MKVITMESSAFTALTEQIAEIAVYVRAVSGETEAGNRRQAAHHPRGGAPAEREYPHPPAYAQRTAHRLCGAARQMPLPPVGNTDRLLEDSTVRQKMQRH